MQASVNLDDLPLAAPGLFRFRTAPPTSGSQDHDGRVTLSGPGAFTQWQLKRPSEGGGKGPRHQRNETLNDYRFDSIGSAADWSHTLEGGPLVGFRLRIYLFLALSSVGSASVNIVC